RTWLARRPSPRKSRVWKSRTPSSNESRSPAKTFSASGASFEPRKEDGDSVTGSGPQAPLRDRRLRHRLERVLRLGRHVVDERGDVAVAVPAVLLLRPKLEVDDAPDGGIVHDLPAAAVADVLVSLHETPDGAHRRRIVSVEDGSMY